MSFQQRGPPLRRQGPRLPRNQVLEFPQPVPLARARRAERIPFVQDDQRDDCGDREERNAVQIDRRRQGTTIRTMRRQHGFAPLPYHARLTKPYDARRKG